MTDRKTEQEEFWAGEFGADYIDRNRSAVEVGRGTALFASMLRRAHGVTSVLELGANIGGNLRAIRNLLPGARLTAVEINRVAAEELARIEDVQVHVGSILDFEPSRLGRHDVTFTVGVLIHVNPKDLPEVYRRLYECSSGYICMAEYYNPTPVEVSYRGHAARLFKRDFAGELMDRYSDVELVDYGFQYHRDPSFPQDDINWFTMRKTS